MQLNEETATILLILTTIEQKKKTLSLFSYLFRTFENFCDSIFSKKTPKNENQEKREEINQPNEKNTSEEKTSLVFALLAIVCKTHTQQTNHQK